MDATTRQLVRERAQYRCEYCLLPESAIDLPFHIEHIVATVHRVDHGSENLAWSCARCNLRKGPSLATIDATTGEQVNLFHPRRMIWSDHFDVDDGKIVGVTACGRGTVDLLGMNCEHRVRLRRELIARGEFEVS